MKITTPQPIFTGGELVAGKYRVETGLLNPGAIAIDGEAVYYLLFGTSYGSSNGELRRIAKP